MSNMLRSGDAEILRSKVTSNIIPPTLLQLNQPPPPRLFVTHLLRYPRHAHRIRHQLHLVLLPRRQLARFDLAIHMYFLRPRRDDENGHLPRLQHPRMQNVHMPNIQYPAIDLQPRRRPLLLQRRIDTELSRAQPELQRLGITFHVRVQNFGKDILAHFAQERLDLERRVHLAEFFDHHGGFVFGEEAGDAVGDGARGGDEGVFGGVVGGLEGEEGLHEAGVGFEVGPGFAPSGVFVEGYVGAGAGARELALLARRK